MLASFDDVCTLAELDARKSLLDALMNIVRVGLSLPALICSCLPSAWLVLERLAVDCQPACQHRSPLFPPSELFDISIEVFKGLSHRIQHTLNDERFDQMLPIKLASKIHCLTEDFEHFCIFFSQMMNWKAPCCQVNSDVGGILRKLPADCLPLVISICFASLCLPEYDTFRAGVSATKNLLPMLHNWGILTEPHLLFNLNVSLLVMLVKRVGAVVMIQRLRSVAAIFAKLFQLVPADQAVSLKRVLNEKHEFRKCFHRASPVDRKQLRTMLTQSRTIASAGIRALELFINKCS